MSIQQSAASSQPKKNVINRHVYEYNHYPSNFSANHTGSQSYPAGKTKMIPNKTVSEEDIRRIEPEMLQRPASDWSSSDFDLFNIWFSQSGRYYLGLKHLMRMGHPIVNGKVKSRPGMSQEDAEDTIQDWWIKFYQDKQFDPSKGSFINYFITGINLIALNKNRKGRRNISLDETLPMGGEKTGSQLLDYLVATGRMKGNTSLPDDEIERKEIHQYILSLIRELHETSRYVRHARAIELLYLNGLPYQQVAEILGVTQNHARLLVHRGINYMGRIAKRDGFATFEL